MAQLARQAAQTQESYKVTDNAPLGTRGWFHTGGPAEKLVKVSNMEALCAYMKDYPEEDLHVFGILSNTIIRDGGIKGSVIRLGRDFARIELKDSTLLYAGTMVLDKNLSRFAAVNGISGLEFFSGIPGTVGGALRMNAGCYGTETKDVLVEAYGVDRTGNARIFRPEDLNMSYRHSEVPEGVILTGALFRGMPGRQEDTLEAMRLLQAKRQKSQPIREKTGGSTFANPAPDELEQAGISPDTKTWQLIEAAGGRGLQIGGAQMSNKHCNFMINTGSASASDLEELGEEIRRRVAETSGIKLRWEIRREGEHKWPKQ